MNTIDKLGNKPTNYTRDFSYLTSGELSLMLTRDVEFIRQAQALRRKIFFTEAIATNMCEADISGTIDGADKTNEANTEDVEDANSPIIDEDEFDELCDHLIVLHNKPDGSREIIGTYRFLKRTAEEIKASTNRDNLFYTQTEFDISRLLDSGKNLMELGRSCIMPEFRTGSAINLLWQGIAAYTYMYNIDYLFGCASFAGVESGNFSEALSYLMNYRKAPEEILPVALASKRADFELIPQEKLDKKQGFASLPPLIKGYVRVGAFVGEGAIIDEVCQTTDVCIIVDKTKVEKRYFTKFMESKE